MNKSLISRTFLCTTLMLLALLTVGCSGSKNDSDQKSTSKKINSITMSFTSNTSTENGVTKDKIDKPTLEKYTKSLSDIFSKGSRVPSLFVETIFENAKPIFDPPKDATDEKISVDLNVLKSEASTDNIAVAHIKQSKLENGKSVTREGILYFNDQGLLTGYKLAAFESIPTTDVTSTEVPS